jgi:hypothetical protein
VLPMVPGGNGLHEFILYDESKFEPASMRRIVSLTQTQKLQKSAERKPRSDLAAKPGS